MAHVIEAPLAIGGINGINEATSALCNMIQGIVSPRSDAAALCLAGNGSLPVDSYLFGLIMTQYYLVWISKRPQALWPEGK